MIVAIMLKIVSVSPLARSPVPPHSQASSLGPWEDVERQRQRGAYPFTHLHHKKEEEIWIDPLKLPDNISR